MNSLTGFFQKVRIEGEDALEYFLGSMLLVPVNSRKAFAGVADDDCVAEEDLILARYVVENGGDGR